MKRRDEMNISSACSVWVGDGGHPRACSAGDEGGTTDILVRALAGGWGMMDIHGACSVGPWLMVEGQSFL